MTNFKKHTKGETILEAIIALSILAIGITMASTIVGYSLHNINTSKNRVIAVNIAREGIEAMRNIRDTNWLKFSGKRRQCWNNNPKIDPCTGSDPIEPGRYIIYKEEGTYKWQLDHVGGGLPEAFPDNPITDDVHANDESTYISKNNQWIDYRALYYVDIDSLVDTDENTDFNDDADMYNHIFTDPTTPALGKDHAKKTVFKRHIDIDYLTNDGRLISEDPPIDLSADHNRMRITATVVWQEGKNEFNTELATHLTDYLGRESLSN